MIVEEKEINSYAKLADVDYDTMKEAIEIAVDILGSGYVLSYYSGLFMTLCEWYNLGIEKGKNEL